MLQIRPPIVLSIFFIIIATYLRFSGLGKWDLAGDEYYFTKSILSIADNGFPNFPNGGYYMRGILLQYLIAPLTLFLDNTEFAVRLVPAISNIFTIPAIYLISKKLGGDKVAVLATFLFCFSLWEIEFARFARMYSPFQFVFMWQIYFLLKYLLENNTRDLKIVLGLAFVSIFIYAGSIFMIFVAMFGLVLKAPNKPVQYWSLILFTLSICLPFYSINFRKASPPPSVGTEQIIDTTSSSPIYLPNILLLEHNIQTLGMVIFASAIIISLIILFRSRSLFISKRFSIVTNIIFLSLIGSLFLNQLLLSLLLLSLLLMLGGIGIERLLFIRIAQTSFILLIIWLLAWVGIILIKPDFTFVELFSYFLDFPKIKSSFIWHWLKAMPVHTILIFTLLTIYYLLLVSDNFKKGPSIVGVIYSLAILLILVTCTIKTRYHTTRYTFYLYPLLLILSSCAIMKISSLAKHGYIKNMSIIALSLIFIIFSEPFNLDHLANIKTAKYNYRAPYDKYRAELYFLRLDFRSTASYLNKQVQPTDEIITIIPVVDYYLNRDVNYTFIRAGHMKGVLSCEGTCFIWNGTPVILDQSELIELIKTANNNLWIISPLSRFNPLGKTQQYLFDVQNKHIEYINFDKSIAVYKF